MMKIERHNYEEFFILYWDNELTAAQKQAVEDFVSQNADLREEFELLGETRFAPEESVQFKGKDILLTNSFINITNYEEQLLDYIDDEVSAEQRKEVEKFVGENPAAQKELALLQKTKLQVEEEINFPDKSVLYRREEKVRVISISWFRVAVAAAIILMAGITVFQFVNTGGNGKGPSIVETKPGEKPADLKKDESKDQTTQGREPDVAGNNDKSKKEDPKQNTVDTKTEGTSLASTSKKSVDNKINSPIQRKDLIKDNKDVAINGNVPATVVPLKKVDKVQREESGLLNDVFANADVTLKDHPTFDIPEAEQKEKDGGGLKEFLRKTTRVFERRTKMQTTTEDNKLLVGAFAVSLK